MLNRPNVAAEVASVEFDLIDCIVCSPFGSQQRVADRSDTQNTTARCEDTVFTRLSPGMKNDYIDHLMDVFQSDDSFPGFIVAWIPFGCHDDANGGTGVPVCRDRVELRSSEGLPLFPEGRSIALAGNEPRNAEPYGKFTSLGAEEARPIRALAESAFVRRATSKRGESHSRHFEGSVERVAGQRQRSDAEPREQSG